MKKSFVLAAVLAAALMLSGCAASNDQTATQQPTATVAPTSGM